MTADRTDNKTIRPQPLYLRVKSYIPDKIKTGAWISDTRVHSEKELVDLMGVSRVTTNRAMRELTTEGHLIRI